MLDAISRVPTAPVDLVRLAQNNRSITTLQNLTVDVYTHYSTWHTNRHCYHLRRRYVAVDTRQLRHLSAGAACLGCARSSTNDAKWSAARRQFQNLVRTAERIDAAVERRVLGELLEVRAGMAHISPSARADLQDRITATKHHPGTRPGRSREAGASE